MSMPVTESWAPLPGVRIAPEPDVVRCEKCGGRCSLGITIRAGLLAVCAEHGSFLAQGDREAVTSDYLIQAALSLFLANRLSWAHEFLIIQSPTLECNYLLLRADNGRLDLEVCSRERNCPRCGNPSISAVGKVALHELRFCQCRQLGFENPHILGVGPFREFLVALIKTVFVEVYADPEPEVRVYFRHPAMTRELLARLMQRPDRSG